ncbi:MAG: carboxymuconolactone decarboxylase family protein [Phycisphaerales bacterium]
MPRIPLIDPSQASGKTKEIFDGPLKGKHLNIFKAMGNSPAALEFYLGAAGALKHAALTAAEQEVVQLAIGAANDCDYCQAAHTAIGKSVGLTDAQTVGARRGTVEADPRLNALAKFALKIHEKKGFVDDADITAFKGAGFNDGHVMEVVGVYALATFTNYVNHIAQTPVDFPSPPALS